MLLTKKVYKTAFIERLREHNLNVYFVRNNYFILIYGNDSSRIVNVELITSTKIIPEIHGSLNDNSLQGIGHFKFTIPKWEDKIHYYAFAFLNIENRNIEYVIVKDEVLRSRFKNQNRIPIASKKAELTLWLMHNRQVYDSTNISLEGEWYFMSSGMGGRMADGSDWDYTACLNNWVEIVEAVKG